jgi:hypothetical protein
MHSCRGRKLQRTYWTCPPASKLHVLGIPARRIGLEDHQRIATSEVISTQHCEAANDTQEFC